MQLTCLHYDDTTLMSCVLGVFFHMTDLYTLKGYIAERQGEREDMQDAHVIMDDVQDNQTMSNDM